MAKEIKIEKGIPMPTRSCLPPNFPLGDMKIGDSFALSISSQTDLNTTRQRLHRFMRENSPKRFTARKVNDNEVRVFRIEDYKRIKST